MRYPNLQHENQLLKKGFQYIAGVDEVGRGALAGPILAAAVILNPKKRITGIKDSKLLTPKKRQELFQKIIENCLAYSIGAVDQFKIDKFGINRANILAMKFAVQKLKPCPDHLLIDAVKLSYKNLPSMSIIHGDRQISSIAAASVVAKVVRDKIMKQYHPLYPKYNFHLHKGYGTKNHFAMIKKYGPSEIHRQSYQPIKNLLN